MFGSNPIRKMNRVPEGSLRVQDIFATIQGEGPHAGRSAIFVRLAGCNLRCTFCDTDFESNYNEPPISADALAVLIPQASQGRKNWIVVITGGEPLLQNLEPLISLLAKQDVHCQIETAGTLWDSSLNRFTNEQLTVVVSPKTPQVNLTPDGSSLYFKYIIKAGQVDKVGLPNASTQKKIPDLKPAPLYRDTYWLGECPHRIYVQPMDENDAGKNAANLAEAIKSCTTFGYTLSLQQHKILNLP